MNNHDADLQVTEATACVLYEVARERCRQDAKWGEQNHPDGTGGEIDRITSEATRRACKRAADRGGITWRHILAEEVYEGFGEPSADMLRTELIQVAAVAVAWVEAIDRRRSR